MHLSSALSCWAQALAPAAKSRALWCWKVTAQRQHQALFSGHSFRGVWSSYALVATAKERQVRSTCKMTGAICPRSGDQLKLAKSSQLLFCHRPAPAEADDQCPLTIMRLSLPNEMGALQIPSTPSFPPKYRRSLLPCNAPVLQERQIISCAWT